MVLTAALGLTQLHLNRLAHVLDVFIFFLAHTMRRVSLLDLDIEVIVLGSLRPLLLDFE